MNKIVSSMIRILVKATVKTMYRFSSDNMSSIPKTGPAVCAVNSVSFIDPLLVTAALQRPALFLVNKRDLGHFRFKSLVRACNVVSVDFTDISDIKHGLEKAEPYLANGGLVVMFPEGKISRSGFLNAFGHWHSELAGHFNCPVIPLYIDFMRGSRSGAPGKTPINLIPGIRSYASVLCGAALSPHVSPFYLRQAIQDLSVRAFELRKDRFRKSLGYLMIRCARNRWTRPAMVDTTGKVLSAGNRLVASVALADMVKKRFADERAIGILLPASCGAAVLNAAVTLAGKIPVNLNFTTAAENIGQAISACGISIVITSRTFLHKLPKKPNLGIMVYLEDLLWELSLVDRAIALIKALFVPASLLVNERSIRPDDCATIVFSSGSSANPKGVMLSHHNIISNLEQMHTVFDFNCDDCMAAALPFFHSFGLTVTLWFPLVAGFRVAYHPNPLDAGVMVDLIGKNNATILPTTPTFLQGYARKARPEDFSRLRLVITGAEKLRPTFAREFFHKFKVVPLQGYGATELSPVAALNVPDAVLWDAFEQGNRLATVGRLLPGMSMRIVDPHTRSPLGPGKSGLLIVKGPNVMKGYLHRSAETAEALSDGWYCTGDIAAVSPDGFITLTDRLARFSKIGGEMVPHGAIEDLYCSALATSERVVAVTAVPDDRRGEKLVVLFTEQAGGIDDLSAIMESAAVPNLWKPQRDAYVKVKAIPMLGAGKTDLKRVKTLAAEAFSGIEMESKNMLQACEV